MKVEFEPCLGSERSFTAYSLWFIAYGFTAFGCSRETKLVVICTCLLAETGVSHNSKRAHRVTIIRH